MTTKAFNESGVELDVLTNGVFETMKSDPGFNRVDLSIGASVRFDFAEQRMVDLVSIAGGNASWGGTEMPREIEVQVPGDAGEWTTHTEVVYEIEGGANNPANAERHDIQIDPPVATSQVRLVFKSTHGNGSIVVRQVEFGGKATGPEDRAGTYVSEIHEVCSTIIAHFTELEADIRTVANCRLDLGRIQEKGVEVSSAFEPLEMQCAKIQGSRDLFADRLASIKETLAQLQSDMAEECAKVGPL